MNPIRVMLVDDDPNSLEIRRMILGRAGHTVFLAPSAEKARQLARMMEMEIAVIIKQREISKGAARVKC